MCPSLTFHTTQETDMKALLIVLVMGTGGNDWRSEMVVPTMEDCAPIAMEINSLPLVAAECNLIEEG